MNTVLLKKEIRELMLCFWLSVGLMLVLISFITLEGFVDINPEDTGADTGSSSIELILVFSLILGGRALTRDRDEGTEGFIDGLPISRRSVFLHKLMAAAVTMAAILGAELFFGLCFQWVSATSISPSLDFPAIGKQFLLKLLFGMTVISVTMLTSFTKQFSPLFTGLLLILFTVVFYRGGELSRWIDSPVLFEGNADFPLKAVFGHITIAAIAFYGSWLLFSSRESRFLLEISKKTQSGFLRFLKGPAFLLGVGIWIAAIFWSMSDSDEEAETSSDLSISAGDSPDAEKSAASVFDSFSSHETDAYEVIFRESQRKRVAPVFPMLDRVHGQVLEFFGNPEPASSLIVLDMASVVARHAAGQVNWTKIRIPSHQAIDKKNFERVLRHETAHVFIEKLSDGAASTYFGAFRSFHEGMATFVEHESDEKSTKLEREKMERSAVLSDRVRKVPLELLVDDIALEEERISAVLVYPLGMVFAEALIEVGGDDIPQRILESLKTSPPPARSGPVEFWKHVLRDCGVTFESVISSYRSKLKKMGEQRFTEELPVVTGEISEEGRLLRIKPNHEGKVPGGFKVVLAVKPDTGIAEIPNLVPSKSDGSFLIPRPQNGKKLTYAFGWVSKSLSLPVFQSWEKEK